jgi:hypothetical protein
MIAPPPDGLIGYRDSVSLALKELTDGLLDTPSSAEPSGPTPADPEWAGAVGYSLKRSGWTPLTPDELWKVVESSSAQHDWQVMCREPGRLLHLRQESRAGVCWLQLRVAAVSGRGSAYHQRMTFYPKGIPGRVYWYAGLSRRRKAFRAIFRSVMDRSVIG